MIDSLIKYLNSQSQSLECKKVDLIIFRSQDLELKNTKKDEKWYKTPNKVKSKDTTRPMMRLTSNKSAKSTLHQSADRPMIAVAAKER